MGLSKWIIKNGIGGVGWMTKFWVKQYLNYPNHLGENDKRLSLIKNFQHTQMTSNNLIRASDPKILLQYSDNCLATLIFCLLCNTTGFEKNTSSSKETFNDVVSVIYEIVSELAPNFTKNSLSEFKSKCTIYLNTIYL